MIKILGLRDYSCGTFALIVADVIIQLFLYIEENRECLCTAMTVIERLEAMPRNGISPKHLK
jgi:hypothetical protein